MRLEYFQMIDRITLLEVPTLEVLGLQTARPDTPGGRIVASCQVPEQSPVFEGHFPGYPIMPGVLLIETMAQTGGWLILAVRRCAKMGLKGVKVSCSWDMEPMWHPLWEPLWQVTNEVQLPLHFHTFPTTPPRARPWASFAKTPSTS